MFLKPLLVPIVIAAIALTVFWFARPIEVSFAETCAGLPDSEYTYFADIDGCAFSVRKRSRVSARKLAEGCLCFLPFRAEGDDQEDQTVSRPNNQEWEPHIPVRRQCCIDMKQDR